MNDRNAATDSLPYPILDAGLRSSGSEPIRSTTSCPDLTIVQKTINQGVLKVPYTQSLKTAGSSTGLSWSISSGILPVGLSLNPTSGRIDGIPLQSGQFQIGISVSDGSDCRGYRDYTLRISSSPFRVRNDEPEGSFISSQIPGSILIYNLFTSSVASSKQSDTRLTTTNTNQNKGIFAHVLLIDSNDGGVVDHNMYLPPNRTTSLSLSDFDPGTTGYIVTIAIDETGSPVNFNFLLGEAFVKLENGPAFNLPALTVSALSGWISPIEPDNVTAVIRFDGISYSQLPLALAISNMPAISNINETTIVLNLIDGDLRSGVGIIGTIYGMLYNELGEEACFGIYPNNCQYRFVISNNIPRTVPRYDQLITSKKTGWMKFWVDAGQAITGSIINYSSEDAVQSRNHAHNLHAITMKDSATLITNVYPPI